MPGAAVRASGLLIRIGRALRTALDQEFEDLGLTSQQAGLLIHVHTGVTAPKALAELLGTDTAAISRLLDRLEDKGLVARTSHAADRRAVVVGLTRRGRALVPRLPPVFEAVGRRLVRGVDSQRTLDDLTRMLANLERRP
jgi:DNA-binding MarR family transcriptional regulator